MKKKLLSILTAIMLVFTVVGIMPIAVNAEEGKITVIVHYQRKNADYDGWNLWIWPDGGNGSENRFVSTDDWGKIAVFKKESDAKKVGIIVRKGDWEEKDVGDDRFIELDENGFAEVWISEGVAEIATEVPEGATKYDPSQVAEQASETVATDGLEVKIHYHRFDEIYDDWNLWLWGLDADGNGTDGAGYAFNEEDEFGKIYEGMISGTAGCTQIGLIVRKGDWDEKDIETDRFVNVDEALNADGQVEFYLVEGDATIYTDSSEIDLTPKFKSASIQSSRTIDFVVSSPFSGSEKALKEKFILKDNEGNNVNVKTIITEGSKTTSGKIMLEDVIDFTKQYTLTSEDYGEIPCVIGNAFNSDAFAESFTYTGDDLGATYSKDKTVFKVWAPTALEVSLNLYEKGDGDNLKETLKMEKAENGVWEKTVEGDLNGVYYTYSVDVGTTVNEAVDLYARATGVNGMRGMVIDLDATDPEGWDKDEYVKLDTYSDAIIYETHVRDFSIDESSGMENKGKYLAFTEENTKSPNTGVATGIEHLKDLGITHVQLQPVFDFCSVDETKLDEPQFNWGYDPENYNVPEGSYSTDPYNGEVRVNEFKQMVQSLHDNDIGVIMDVVYNHTGKTEDSNMNLIVPNYYYRKNSNGSFSNGSGCGNETASEREMVRKYIIDSVKYWVEEYHIDGFRFDLMGVHDIETMNMIKEELQKINPSIIVYGEGWTGGTTLLADEDSALKKNVVSLNGVGAFSDDLRDGIKGSVFDSEDQGFVSGAENKEESIKFGIIGCTQNNQIDYEKVNYSDAYWANFPYQSLSYSECHDNLTLWDKLHTSTTDKTEDQLIAMDKLAASIVIPSQGVTFMQLGQDFLRSKPKDETGETFEGNSYKSSDFTNSIKWDRKDTYSNVYEYYKGLIAFKKAHDAFRMQTPEEIQENLIFMNDLDPNMVGYTISNNANGDISEKIMVVYNANEEDKTITLPEGKWDVFVNGEKAGTEVIETLESTVTVEPLSAVILAQNTNEAAQAGSFSIFGLSTPITITIIVVLVVIIALVIFMIVKSKSKKA